MLWLLSLTSTPEVGTNFWWLKARHLFWNDSLWEINHGSPIITHCKQSKRPSPSIPILCFVSLQLASLTRILHRGATSGADSWELLQFRKSKLKSSSAFVYMYTCTYVCMCIYIYNDSLLKVLKGLQTWSPTYINKSINPRILTASRYLY